MNNIRLLYLKPNAISEKICQSSIFKYYSGLAMFMKKNLSNVFAK